MDKDLEKLFGTINKKFGDKTIQFLTEDYRPEVKVYSTGSLTLDLALGRGGIPRGRIIEVYGPSMAGKTSMAFLHLAEVQRSGEGYVVFVDAEHAFDPKLATEYGIDLEKLIYINPLTAENAIDTIDALIRSGKVRAIVVDSVSALTPTKVAESSIEQQTIGLLARLMSTTMQKLNGIAHQHDCEVIFINQIREKVGVMYGNPETTSGGRALPFYASVRLHVRMGEQIKEKDEVIGHLVKVKVTKNKVATPFKEAVFPLIYGQGVDRIDEVSQIAILAGIIEQAGAWFRYKNENGEIVVRDGVEYKWQGRNSLVEFIKETPDFLVELENKIRGVEVEAPDGEPVTDQDGYEHAVEE